MLGEEELPQNGGNLHEPSLNRSCLAVQLPERIVKKVRIGLSFHHSFVSQMDELAKVSSCELQLSSCCLSSSRPMLSWCLSVRVHMHCTHKCVSVCMCNQPRRGEKNRGGSEKKLGNWFLRVFVCVCVCCVRVHTDVYADTHFHVHAYRLSVVCLSPFAKGLLIESRILFFLFRMAANKYQLSSRLLEQTLGLYHEWWHLEFF